MLILRSAFVRNIFNVDEAPADDEYSIQGCVDGVVYQLTRTADCRFSSTDGFSKLHGLEAIQIAGNDDFLPGSC